MLFIMSMNFTERGIREIKDDPKRAQAAKDLAKKCGCEIKQVYLTSGEYDLMQIIENQGDILTNQIPQALTTIVPAGAVSKSHLTPCEQNQQTAGPAAAPAKPNTPNQEK